MPYVGRTPSAVPVTADDIPANSIDSANYVDGSIDNAHLADDAVGVDELSATGTASSSTYLRGDNSWVTITDTDTVYTHPTTHATADIADNAITEAKIADAAVVSLKSGRKNLIINGGFDVWQRGTTGAIVGSGYATADRWRGNLYSNGTVLLEKKTDATEQDFTTYARFQQSVAGTVSQKQGLIHIIEGTHAVGKTITISFKARASKPLASCLVRGAIALHTYDLTTEWQSFSFTGTGVANGSNTWVMFDFGFENDTWYVDLAQVQLEVGSVATDFEHRSYGEELALCQRYYYRNTTIDQCIGARLRWGSAYGPMGERLAHPVEMRVSPTINSKDSAGTVGAFTWFDGTNYNVGKTGMYGDKFMFRFEAYNESTGSTASYASGSIHFQEYSMDAEL